MVVQHGWHAFCYRSILSYRTGGHTLISDTEFHHCSAEQYVFLPFYEQSKYILRVCNDLQKHDVADSGLCTSVLDLHARVDLSIVITVPKYFWLTLLLA